MKKPQELTGSDSLTNYKRALRKITNLDKKLKEHHFDFQKFWKKSDPVYEDIKNESDKIRLK